MVDLHDVWVWLLIYKFVGSLGVFRFLGLLLIWDCYLLYLCSSFCFTSVGFGLLFSCLICLL